MGKMSLTSCRALSTPGKFSNVDRYAYGQLRKYLKICCVYYMPENPPYMISYYDLGPLSHSTPKQASGFPQKSDNKFP